MRTPLSQAPRTRLRARQVFLAFEGGGAAGLAHVGALRAFEIAKANPDNPMEVGAYSGTSAGAMVAALAAVGYTADEMISPRGGHALPRRTLLDAINDPDGRPYRTAPGLFGTAGWRRISAAVTLMNRGSAAAVLAVLLLAGLMFAGWLGSSLLLDWLLGPLSGTQGVWIAAAAMLLAILLVGLLLLFVAVRPVLRGLARTDTVRDAFNEALRVKLGLDKGTLVRFRHLRPEVELKIVTTNISDGRLEIFSRATTPEHFVADAVAASVCLPVVFGPKAIEGSLHFDGGLVSNLPAWPFDEERLLDRDSLTIGFSVGGALSTRKVTDSTWLVPTLRTAIFGSDVLSTRGAGRIEIIRMPTKINVLGFDLKLDDARAEVAFQSGWVLRRLNDQILVRPRELYLRCARVALLARVALRDLGPRRYRVAIALPENYIRGGFLPAGFEPERVQSFALRYGFGYRDQRDEGLVIPAEMQCRSEAEKPPRLTVIGEAFRTGKPVFAALVGARERYAGPWNRCMLGGRLLHNRVRQRQVPPDLAWMLAVPVPVPGPELDEHDRMVPLEGLVVITSINDMSRESTKVVPRERAEALVPSIQSLFRE